MASVRLPVRATPSASSKNTWNAAGASANAFLSRSSSTRLRGPGVGVGTAASGPAVGAVCTGAAASGSAGGGVVDGAVSSARPQPEVSPAISAAVTAARHPAPCPVRVCAWPGFRPAGHEVLEWMVWIFTPLRIYGARGMPAMANSGPLCSGARSGRCDRKRALCRCGWQGGLLRRADLPAPGSGSVMQAGVRARKASDLRGRLGRTCSGGTGSPGPVSTAASIRPPGGPFGIARRTGAGLADGACFGRRRGIRRPGGVR